MKINVRPSTERDEPALLAIDAASFSPDSAFPSVNERISDGSFFRDQNRPEDYLVAELDGVVSGYIKLNPPYPLPENAHVLRIWGLDVAPEARRKGVASALLQAAEEQAERNGLRKLSLGVFSTNSGAIRLYEKHGFTVEGRLKGEFLINDRLVDDIIMAKHLSPPP